MSFDPDAFMAALVAGAAAARGDTVPPSREVVSYQAANPAARRVDGRTREQVNRRARLRALRLAWEGRGIAWDVKAAEALVDGRKGLALRHFAREGVVPGADRSDLR